MLRAGVVRLRRGLVAASVIIVLTLVLFIALNIGLAVYFARHDPPPDPDSCRRGTLTSCPYLYRIARFRLRVTLEEARTRTYNVDDEGWRVDAARRRLFERFSRDDFNVFVFGGSTVFGVPVEDAQTLPAHLQRMLDARDGVRARRVRVYNLGQGGYAIKEELYILVDQLKLGRRPDVALFYDGANEALGFWTDGMYRQQDWGYEEVAAAFDRAQRPPAWAVHLPILTAARRFREKLGLPSALEARHAALDARPRDVLRHNAAAQADSYIESVRVIMRLARAYDFPAVFVLQPFTAFIPGGTEGRYGIHPAMGGGRAAYYRDLYPMILERASKERPPVAIVDLSQALTEPARANRAGIFTDMHHLTGRGNELMAGELVTVLKPYLPRQ